MELLRGTGAPFVQLQIKLQVSRLLEKAWHCIPTAGVVFLVCAVIVPSTRLLMKDANGIRWVEIKEQMWSSTERICFFLIAFPPTFQLQATYQHGRRRHFVLPFGLWSKAGELLGVSVLQLQLEDLRIKLMNAEKAVILAGTQLCHMPIPTCSYASSSHITVHLISGSVSLHWNQGWFGIRNYRNSIKLSPCPLADATKDGWRRISTLRDLQIPVVQPLLSLVREQQARCWHGLCERGFVLASSVLSFVCAAGPGS